MSPGRRSRPRQDAYVSAKKRGIEIHYSTRGLSLFFDGHTVDGVRVRQDGEIRELSAKSVILASGGFEAEPGMADALSRSGLGSRESARHPYNFGDGIRWGSTSARCRCGNWSGCHAVQWDCNAPEFGDLAVGDSFQNIPIRSASDQCDRPRFVDEGADSRNYTYAKYGRVVLEQPDQFAWQIFDRRSCICSATNIASGRSPKYGQDPRGVRTEARRRRMPRSSLRDQGIQRCRRIHVPFNPNVKDARSTAGLESTKPIGPIRSRRPV